MSLGLLRHPEGLFVLPFPFMWGSAWYSHLDLFHSIGGSSILIILIPAEQISLQRIPKVTAFFYSKDKFAWWDSAC